MKERVAIIENYQDRALGIPRFVEKNGLDSDVFKIHKSEHLPSPGDHKYVILSGGPMGVYELWKPEYSYINEEANYIKDCMEKGVAILGICFGHQLLTNILGGNVIRDESKTEIGWSKIRLTPDGSQDQLFKGHPSEEMEYFQYHNDLTATLPPDTINLATSEVCPTQAFRLMGHPVWGVQFHPEIGPGLAKKILLSRKEILEKKGLDVFLAITKGFQRSSKPSEIVFYNFLHSLK